MIIGGDTHGNWKPLFSSISQYDIRDRAIIIAGDCGFGFNYHDKEVKTVKYLNKSFVARNNQLYLLRGNHDNPHYWNAGNLSHGNIHFVPDYSILPIEGHNVLFLGGAISIDRLERKLGLSYWINEPFILDLDKLATIRDVDVVVSHSCPNFCYPLGQNGIPNYWHQRDIGLLELVIKERNDLAKAYDKLSENNKISLWAYGHFHEYKREEIRGTIFILNECNAINDFTIPNKK